MQTEECDFVEVIHGVDIQKCHKLKAAELDKLNRCSYIQAHHNYDNVAFINSIDLQRSPGDIRYIICPFFLIRI